MKAAILSVAGPDLLAEEASLFRAHDPWAVILMGRSCVDRSQVQRLVDAIWEALGRACLVFIDQEGGRVARLKAPEWPIFPPAKTYGDLYQKDPSAGLEATWLGHRLMAAELADMGIHADCSPVVDLSVPGAHDIIGDRAFGTDPETVSTLARAALEGLSDGGVAGVIKHIPGHGRAVADSHLELPRVTSGDNELAADFAAFAAVSDAPMAMTAHISYDSIDADAPATHSRRLISDVIRNRIGFDGLLMTDDLGMKALEGTLAERGARAIEAGCDVLLHCSGFAKHADEVLAEMTEVAEAAPLLSGKALERAERAEAMSTRAKPFDQDAAWARFEALMATGGAA
ncbi:MAG: beta-N-acetylhexosaminidase [Pseudomonadota bacterium]